MKSLHESQIAPKAGIPLLVMPYTSFCVSFWFEMMHTASASNSRTRRYVSLTMSGLPCSRVSAKAELKDQLRTEDKIRTVYHSARVCREKRVHELVSESLADIG